MAILFGGKDTTEKINELLRTEIRYHKCALDCCTKEFPYFSDIKTSLAECYAQLGHNYFRAGIYNDAIDFYKKAIDYNQHHLQARNQLGLIYFRKGLLIEATECFQELVKLADGDYNKIHKTDALLSLALICCKEAKQSSFRKAYKYVIEADKIINDYPLVDKIMKNVMDAEKEASLSIKVKSKQSIFINKSDTNNQIHDDDFTRTASLEAQ